MTPAIQMIEPTLILSNIATCGKCSSFEQPCSKKSRPDTNRSTLSNCACHFSRKPMDSSCPRRRKPTPSRRIASPAGAPQAPRSPPGIWRPAATHHGMESGNDSLANGAARLSGMFNRVWKHLRRHPWFYLALACGAAAWLATGALPRNVRLAVTGDTFYLAYLILTASFVVRVPTDRFRDWIDDRDEGLIIVTLVTLDAVAFSLVSIFTLLNAGHKLSGAYLGLS